MKTLILSPHVDDAIFSLGDYIQTLEDVTILSIFAGIPTDTAGMNKHTTLRKEHERACNVLGIHWINGDFLDDVYIPRPNIFELVAWLQKHLRWFDYTICPLGIHHPDHIIIRNLVRTYFKADLYYGELPYRLLYPQITKDLINKYHPYGKRIYEDITGLKRKAIECYESQIKSDHIMAELLVPEELYD